MNDNILKIKHIQSSGQYLIIKVQLKYSTDLYSVLNFFALRQWKIF